MCLIVRSLMTFSIQNKFYLICDDEIEDWVVLNTSRFSGSPFNSKRFTKRETLSMEMGMAEGVLAIQAISEFRNNHFALTDMPFCRSQDPSVRLHSAALDIIG